MGWRKEGKKTEVSRMYGSMSRDRTLNITAAAAHSLARKKPYFDLLTEKTKQNNKIVIDDKVDKGLAYIKN